MEKLQPTAISCGSSVILGFMNISLSAAAWVEEYWPKSSLKGSPDRKRPWNILDICNTARPNFARGRGDSPEIIGMALSTQCGFERHGIACGCFWEQILQIRPYRYLWKR